MNKKWKHAPIYIGVIISIVYISLSMPAYTNMFGFLLLLGFAIVFSILLGIYLYITYRSKMDGESLYSMVGISVLFGFIISLGAISFLDYQYATFHCQSSSYTIVGYKGRYASGYGNVGKSKLEANQWLMDVQMDGKVERFVLSKDISVDNRVTTALDLEFCSGVLGTRYLNMDRFGGE